MKRRGLLTGLLGLGAMAATRATAASRPAPAAVLLQDTCIAGSAHYHFDEWAPLIRPGDCLQLRRQTDNPYDDRAVEVFWNQQKIGYLPRSDNAAVASLLDRRQGLRAEVLALQDPEENWEPLMIRLWIEPAA